MSDLISRADAIEAVCGNCLGEHFTKCNQKEWCEDIKALSALPSADTDMSEYCDRLWKIAYERGKAEAEQHNKDAISREGLLKSWEELSPRGRTEFDQVIMTIPALPSAEAVDVAHDIPEYCSWSQTYTNMVQGAMSKASAEAVQGEWTYLSGSKGSYMTISCPICGSTFNGVEEWKYHYCPNCGAKMKGDSE